ncbi:hypothetical protein HRbin15_00057 [bacterium HR15]|nr:hypothetical protein HRbin15_00057 [bacterium HR15]
MRRTMVYLAIAASIGINCVQAQDYGLYIGDRDMERGIVYAYPGITNLASHPFTWPVITQFSDPNFNWGTYDFCYGLAFAPDGILWAGNVLGNSLEQFDATTGAHLGTVPAPISPHGIAIGPPPRGSSSTYAVYVAGAQTIHRYDPGSNTWSTFATLPDGAYSYALRWRQECDDPQICYFVCYVSALGTRAGVYKFSQGGTLIWGPKTDPNYGGYYHEIDFYGRDVLVALTTNCCYTGNGAIWRLDENGNSLGYLATQAPSGPYSGTFFGLAVSPDRQYIYVTEYTTGLLLTYSAQNYPNIRLVDTTKLTSFSYPKVGLALEIGPRFSCAARRCPEDINGDGIVDDADLLAVLFAFGTSCR